MNSNKCEPLCLVDVSNLVKWVADIDRSTWPSWFGKGSERPAVIADSQWEGMAEVTAPVIQQVMDTLPGLRADYPMITTVHPGDFVPYHTDTIHPDWITRIHVPIITNEDAVVIMDDIEQHLLPGMAYTFDISKPHAIANRGKESRIHLMFDVYAQSKTT